MTRRTCKIVLTGVLGMGCSESAATEGKSTSATATDSQEGDASGQTATSKSTTPANGTDGSTSPPDSADSASSIGSGSTGAEATDEGSTGEPPEVVCDSALAMELVVESVAPPDTDPEIAEGPSHLYVEPVEPAVGALFVFFPGTGGPPAGYRNILSHAAMLGYHALGLAYVNEPAVNEVCSVLEAGCHAAARHEIITGEDTSPHVDVNAANSIQHRLVAALQHLSWDRYVEGDAPRWENIVVAGHSQGAGHAAFIARDHVVHRAILFAGTEPADWTNDALATPADRLFGFVHRDDGNADAIVGSWDNLAIPGPLTLVDDAAAPYDGAHQLESALIDGIDNPHGAIVADPSVPLVDGVPVYGPTWCHLIDGES